MRDPLSPPAVVAVLLVVASLLLIANEIRFQGCVSRQDTQRGINLDHPDRQIGVVQCARLPLAAD